MYLQNYWEHQIKLEKNPKPVSIKTTMKLKEFHLR